jgi:hypothetical protein
VRSTFAAKNTALVKSPSVRQLAARRRAATLAGLLVLALGSAVLGASSPQGEPVGRAHTGPFSYFPSE